jgi:hypothetical protein
VLSCRQTYTPGIVASITSGVIASPHGPDHVRRIKTGKQEFSMPVQMTSYLKKALLADAAISGAAAVAMMAGSAFLPPLLGLPAELLLWAGVAMIPFVAGLALVIRQNQVAAGVIVAIIAINIAWVLASLVVAFGPAFAPTLLGKVFVVAQAATVALFAELQIIGLRRARATA